MKIIRQISMQGKKNIYAIDRCFKNCEWCNWSEENIWA